MTSLQIVDRLSDRLHRENIRYCHWKSNEHLDAAVQGKTDLDVLFDRTRKSQLEPILAEVGFKYFEAVPYRRYVDIEDYLAIDEQTGTLVHLHLHYRLELGEKNLKGYHVPWEERLLSTRIYNDEYNFYTVEPHLELIILVVRAVLKIRTRDRLKSLLGGDYFAGDFLREFRWLKERIDRDRLRKLGKELLGPTATQQILHAIDDEANLQQLLGLENPIRAPLRPYRRYHPLVSTGLRWYREAQTLWAKVQRKYFQTPKATHRTPVGGGTIVAILGADGSGKSTVTSEIVSSLSQKLDVLPLYLGSGDGKASAIRQPLIWARKGLKTLRSRRSSKQQSSKTGNRQPNPTSPLSGLGQLVWALVLTQEKRNKLKQARVAKESGTIAICDRYPQSQILGLNDGPLLSDGSKYPQPLQQWEMESYQRMVQAMPPDLVIKLNVTPEVAIARKSETPPETVRQKVEAVRSLTFGERTTVVTIDADGSLDDVLVQAKQAVWAHL